MNESDENLARDIEGNELIDPDDVWEFVGSAEQCPNCEVSFWLPSELLYHEPCFNLSQKGCAKCSEEGCSESYSDLMQLRAHYDKCHQVIESFYCSKCVVRCCSLSEIIEHKYSSHQTEIDNSSEISETPIEEEVAEVDQENMKATTGKDLGNLSNSSCSSLYSDEIRYDVVCSRYRCNDCHEAFNTIHELVLHEGCYEKTGSLLNCPECDVTFTSRLDFKIHLEDIHDTARYFCCQCRAGFEKLQGMREHFKSCLKPSFNASSD